MCTLYLPSLLYAVISLLFNCPQSARAVVTDTLSLTSPPVNPNCELGLRVQRPHDAPDCRSPPARRRNATELTVNKVLRSQPGRVPWSDASDQQQRRTRRGLPRALMGARELARAGEEVLIFSPTRRSRFAPRLAHGRHASARRWSSATGEPWRPYERSRRHDSAVPARPGTCRPRNE